MSKHLIGLLAVVLAVGLVSPVQAEAALPRHIGSFEKLVAPTPQLLASFGAGIALDDETVIVGALREDDLGTQDVGAVYVFTGSSAAGTWSPRQRIPSPLATTWGEFGFGIALNGNRLAIGGGRRGAFVAILERQADETWALVQVVTSPRPSLFESFGRSVALSDSTLVVGAPRTLFEPGTVYVYQFDAGAGSWELSAQFQGSQAEDVDWFGHAVALRGNRLAVGAPRVDGLSSESGVVYLFERSSTGWSEVSVLRPERPEKYDHFGFSVSLSNDRLLTGSPRSNRSHVFDYEQGEWKQTAELTDRDSGDSDSEGAKVALAHGGRQALVTATQAARESGAVYIFQETRIGAWVETWRFYGENRRDQLGISLSVHGNSLAVGSTHDPDGIHQAGAAYLLKAPLLPEAVVDIRPGNPVNPVPISSAARLPIVIHSTSVADGEALDFNASQIDPSTLRVGSNQMNLLGRATRLIDADHDGDLDLELRVRIRDLGLACSDRSLLVHGTLHSGEGFLGMDAVRPVGCH